MSWLGVVDVVCPMDSLVLTIVIPSGDVCVTVSSYVAMLNAEIRDLSETVSNGIKTVL